MKMRARESIHPALFSSHTKFSILELALEPALAPLPSSSSHRCLFVPALLVREGSSPPSADRLTSALDPDEQLPPEKPRSSSWGEVKRCGVVI